MTIIKIKRIYEPPETGDGFRVLIDRLWPRGIAKKMQKIDLWIKELAPSNELRQWFNHDPAKWKEFQKKYKQELYKNKEIFDNFIKLISDKKIVTLLFAASDEIHNNAVVLKDVLVSGLDTASQMTPLHLR